MARVLSLLALLPATPAVAASKNPFSLDFYKLSNTDFIVTLAFLLFVGVLVYYKVPTLVAGLLDKRAAGIREELDEARALREEAESVLAEFESKQREVGDHSERIIAAAKESAEEAAEQARRNLALAIERRIQAAQDQIASAEQRAVKQVREEAVRIAVSAAGKLIAEEMSADRASEMIDEAIATVEAKLQ
ncbi:MAG: ATP F0F1 synthase subunit B [Boseongicola sp. SB0667_bin_21]|nr:ATP F0F1 synthase subunit B [Boseongicola sp. SB0667_bin_21]